MKKTAIENEKQDEVFFEMIMNMEAEMTPGSADTELNKGIQTDEKRMLYWLSVNLYLLKNNQN